MNDFQDDVESVEFVAIDKIQILHQDYELCLEYTFGKNDFVEDTEKQHFLLKFEIIQSIVVEIEKHFGSKISLDLPNNEPVDLLVFLDTLVNEDLSNAEPNLAINIFVVEDFSDLDQEDGVWNHLDRDEVLAENSNTWFGESDSDDEDSTTFMDDAFLQQLGQLLGEKESSKEMLEDFMNHLIMNMLDGQGDLTDDEALQKFLEIVKKREISDANETATETNNSSEIFVDFSQKGSVIKGIDDDPESKS